MYETLLIGTVILFAFCFICQVYYIDCVIISLNQTSNIYRHTHVVAFIKMCMYAT